MISTPTHRPPTERFFHATHLHSGTSASLMAFCLFPDLNSVRKHGNVRSRTKGNGPAGCELVAAQVPRECSSPAAVLTVLNHTSPNKVRIQRARGDSRLAIFRGDSPNHRSSMPVGHAGGCNGEHSLRGKLYAAHFNRPSPETDGQARAPSNQGHPGLNRNGANFTSAHCKILRRTGDV